MQQTTIQQAKAIVNELAGSPNELQRRLNQINVRYVKTNRGFKTVYILRGKNIQRTEITL